MAYSVPNYLLTLSLFHLQQTFSYKVIEASNNQH